MNKNAKKKQGFTLIEILVTLALVAMVGVMIAAFVTPQVNVYRATAERTEANTICNSIFNIAAHELRYGKDFSVDQDGDVLTYTAVTADGEAPAELTAAGLTAQAAPGFTGRLDILFVPAESGISIDVTVYNKDDKQIVRTEKIIASLNSSQG